MITLQSPSQTSYVTQQPDALRVSLSGPASRYRRDVDRTPFVIKATWTTNEYGYQAFRSAYRATARGASPFQIVLVINRQAAATYLAYFVPGSFQLVSVQGLTTFTFAANLEVLQL